MVKINIELGQGTSDLSQEDVRFRPSELCLNRAAFRRTQSLNKFETSY